MTAINELDLDSYVRGVVAGEMPNSWPLEALEAQAVAARTYALATRKTGPFDQYPDIRSQVYRGVTGESVRSDAAVEGTAGRILTYAGQPAVTYYFSTSEATPRTWSTRSWDRFRSRGSWACRSIRLRLAVPPLAGHVLGRGPRPGARARWARSGS